MNSPLYANPSSTASAKPAPKPAAQPRWQLSRAWMALPEAQVLDPELLLSTHLSVVVRVRIDFADGSNHETGLVIARGLCVRECPGSGALLAAARKCVAGLGFGASGKQRMPRQLSVCHQGQWLPLLEREVRQPKKRVIASRPSESPLSRGNSTMNRNTPAILLASLGLMAVACAASQSHAAGSDSAAATYRKERADCLSGRNPQDRATCLKEAGAALAEARHGRLGETTPQQLAQNAVLRCKSQPMKDRPECERLARGEGQQIGTVAQGAVIKEIVTIDMPPTAAGPASSGPTQ